MVYQPSKNLIRKVFDSNNILKMEICYPIKVY